MNREQITCLFVGFLIFAGLFLCVPVPVQMTSLYLYMGDTNAGMNMMTFYEFLPDGWLKAINYGFFIWQCFFVTVIISCLLFVFGSDIKKPVSEIKTKDRLFSIVLITSSLLIYVIGIVDAFLGNVFWCVELELLLAGALGLIATMITINAYVANKSTSLLLLVILISCTILAESMMASYFKYRYSPNEFQITPNIRRLLGSLAFIGIWICYAIGVFMKNKGQLKYTGSVSG